MRGRLHRQDDSYVPRRFEGHGAALRWSVVSVGKLALVFLIGIVASTGFNVLSSEDRSFTLIIGVGLLATVLLFWAVGTLLLYLYLALAGGVMSREERRRAKR